MHDGPDWGQLDCLGEISSLGDFSAVAKQSVEIDLECAVWRIISLDALIAAKTAMAPPRHLAAAEKPRRIKTKNQSAGFRRL